jgi:hypothetical protein
MGKGEIHTGFWQGGLKEENLGDPGIYGRIILKIDLQGVGWRHGLD